MNICFDGVGIMISCVKKVSKLKLYLPGEKRIKTETLIFALAFSWLIPLSCLLVDSSLKYLF